MAAERPRFNPAPDESADLAATFCAAMTEGDLDQLVSLLVEDVVVYGDSGGTRPSWPKPIIGQAAVARLLAGLGGSINAIGLSLRPAEVNGGPGAEVRDAAGRLVNVFSLEVEHGKIGVVRSVINPDKLRHLGETRRPGAAVRGAAAGRGHDSVTRHAPPMRHFVASSCRGGAQLMISASRRPPLIRQLRGVSNAGAEGGSVTGGRR